MKKIWDELKSNLLRIIPHITSIVIFGSSVSKKMQSPNFDIDVAIFVENRYLSFEKLKSIGILQKELSNKYQKRISIWIFDPNSFDMWDKIRLYHISRYHKCIFGKDIIPKSFNKNEIYHAVKKSVWESRLIITRNLINILPTGRIFNSSDLTLNESYEKIFLRRTTKIALDVTKHSVSHVKAYQQQYMVEIVPRNKIEDIIKYITNMLKNFENIDTSELMNIQKYCFEMLTEIWGYLCEKSG
ncbi:MAG: nucleotidyltransferase domain-containing protein [Candidatus Helarchaeota archaeon]